MEEILEGVEAGKIAKPSPRKEAWYGG